jgi:hypothetical protein
MLYIYFFVYLIIYHFLLYNCTFTPINNIITTLLIIINLPLRVKALKSPLLRLLFISLTVSKIQREMLT